MEEPEPVPFHQQPDVPTSFHLVEEGSQRRKTKLVDSLGFSYNIRSKRPYATYWQCTVRPKGNHCKATVIERVGVFTAGQAAHNHPQPVGTYTAAKIISTVKRKAVADVFKPASAIVDEVIVSKITISNSIVYASFVTILLRIFPFFHNSAILLFLGNCNFYD